LPQNLYGILMELSKPLALILPPFWSLWLKACSNVPNSLGYYFEPNLV
jgi:hypothetical protein